MRSWMPPPAPRGISAPRLNWNRTGGGTAGISVLAQVPWMATVMWLLANALGAPLQARFEVAVTRYTPLAGANQVVPSPLPASGLSVMAWANATVALRLFG